MMDAALGRMGTTLGRAEATLRTMEINVGKMTKKIMHAALLF